MPEWPETSEELLIRVRDASDAVAWDRFASIYGPVVYRLARSRGLQDADANDLVQHVLMAVARKLPDWQRSSGGTRLRSWLYTIAKNETTNVLTRLPRKQARGGTTAMNVLRQQPASDCELDEVEIEYRRQLYRHAAQIVRSRADEATWLAFSMTMIDGVSVAAAASELGRSEGMVYAARSRIMNRLRNVVRELEER